MQMHSERGEGGLHLPGWQVHIFQLFSSSLVGSTCLKILTVVLSERSDHGWHSFSLFFSELSI